MSRYFFLGHLNPKLIGLPEVLIFLLINIITIILLILGATLFIKGILDLMKNRKNQQDLTKTGIYGIIRHPQNVGIILFSIGITLSFTEGPENVYRIGDLYSCTLFVWIWLVETKWEDERLIKRLGEEFIIYMDNTPFLIPRGKDIERKIFKLANPGCSFKKRVILWIIYYVTFFYLSIIIITSFNMVYWSAVG
ncbi:MAG: methyltransferase family protein [Candidatus Hodarchaeales archaeon]